MAHSLYIHIPFCRHRCGYCDFNTYAGLGDLVPAYMKALGREIEYVGKSAQERIAIHTIFFGGGTPSLIPLEHLAPIFASIHSFFDVGADAEITLEANPGTVSLDYLRGLRELGVNRLSMGVQSANPQELAILEREHGYADAIEAVKFARQAGFENVSVDLIFGVPYQTLESWQHNVGLALGLRPEHISLYALTIEHGTPLKKMMSRGLLSEPDADLAADMYEWTMDALDAEGFAQYEISNWAKKCRDGGLYASRHNQQYWLNLPYIGVGAGAHGFAGGFRTANVLAPAKYIERLSGNDASEFPRSPASVTAKRVDKRTEMQETMMLGLRLVERGVSAQEFEVRFGEPMKQVFGRDIAELEELGLLEWVGEPDERLRLTRKGRLLGNQVFVRFV